MSDWYDHEYGKIAGGHRHPLVRGAEWQPMYIRLPAPRNTTVDWRKPWYDILQEPRHQGSCGSCWAFATVANVEAVWALATKEIISLSE